MGYIYRLSGQIRITPAPEWADLKRSGFLEWEDRDIRIVPKVEEAGDGRKTVLVAEVEGSDNEPRCYDLVRDLTAMLETFSGRSWSGHIEGTGEDGTDQFRLYVENGRAVEVRPIITWPDRAQ